MNTSGQQIKSRFYLWLLSITACCLLGWFLLVPIIESIFEMVIKIDTIRLKHGYSLDILRDADIGEIYARLSGPDVYDKEQFWIDHGKSEPVFSVNETNNGKVCWVTAKPNLDILVLIDYDSGDYWFYGMRHDWDDAKKKKYLDEINSNGMQVRFTRGPYGTPFRK